MVFCIYAHHIASIYRYLSWKKLNRVALNALTLVHCLVFFVFFNHKLLIHSICCSNWALPHFVIRKAGRSTKQKQLTSNPMKLQVVSVSSGRALSNMEHFWRHNDLFSKPLKDVWRHLYPQFQRLVETTTWWPDGMLRLNSPWSSARGVDTRNHYNNRSRWM